jgi:hypothetical protein
MHRHRDRAWLGLLVRYVALVAVIGFIATAVYAAVDADDRPTVLRLAVAAFVTVVLIHIHSHFRGQLDWMQPSALDQARRDRPGEAKVPAMVMRLREEVQYSAASQRYFRNVLWPRLVELSEERGTRDRLHELRGRPWLRRGPSLAAIAALIARIGEER